MATLDRRDYSTASRLFDALGRKDAAAAIDSALAALDRGDAATARGLFQALASNRPLAATDEPAPAGAAEGERKQHLPPAVIPPVDREMGRPAAAKAGRRPRLLPLAAALACLAALGLALAVSERNGTLGALKARAIASLAAPGEPPLPKATAETATAADDRAAVRDLRAALADMTARLDRIERETGARLDTLAGRIDEGGVPAPANLAARLDALEKADKAAPSPSAPELNALSARLDRLEKKAPVPPAGSDLSARLDKVEKKLAAATARPAPPSKPALAAGAHPPAPDDATRPGAPKRLLQDYVVEDVQNGVAVVASRYGGPQQVAPGDVIPGAGRVLRIERRGGAWTVLTSNGVIASAPAPY